ncbi:LOW QUALITY PROTEIN: ubiquitin carboxyl-terminal hydrolase 25-like [Amphiura filiformis]|uniref:LOW QUALITY PROTEIN: ubiquitin carboxyl-terminal hydrolase 25-like n=1 Tax=Amphiura filiformis TaxID=82378 RepID=UPI003B2288C0
MTVEHNVFQTHVLKNQETILNQLKEITGIQDAQALRHAYDASNGDIAQAISLLTDSSNTAGMCQPAQPTVAAPPADPAVAAAVPTTSTRPKNKQQGKADVIDLTQERDEKEDIQRAIALSLQENTQTSIGVSAEEQDISRALEQSIADNSVAGIRGANTWFVDPRNPYDRQRENGWPVGLKNVGNTCWFSAVIQSLFHLPAFRQLVLGFVPPANAQAQVENVESSTQEHRNLLFMTELRGLFALMLGSKRKYVDPTSSVQILKAAFINSGGSDNQQDVSEFTHKLLEWLEDAFKSDCSRPPSPQPGAEGDADSRQNPMLDLFYGQFKAEGINEGKVFANDETFSQYPLQIIGFHDLHASIEASTSHREIETVRNDSTCKSAQENWFTHLPHVLTFELSRFHFNQALARPEKIHNRFTFPKILYMDRYMECNRAKTRRKREEVHALREQLNDLHTRLERYVNYGSGAKRFPLQDVLQYTLEFANSRSPDSNGSPSSANIVPSLFCNNNSNVQDVEMTSPPRSPPGDDSKVGAAGGSGLPDVAMRSPTTSNPASPALSLFAQAMPPPAPGHITDSELDVLQRCLRRWRTEVESDVAELQTRISALNNSIDQQYEEADLKHYEYHLHAVLVHEGQASAGHYWAYVLNHKRNVWLKFNDISVTEVEWADLERESVGGSGNASAYCLMYVDISKQEIFEEHEDAETGQSSLSLDMLADDLRQLVLDDNQRFAEEMKKWDEEESQRAMAVSTTAEEVTIVGESTGVQTIPTQTPQHQQQQQLHHDQQQLQLYQQQQLQQLYQQQQQQKQQQQLTPPPMSPTSQTFSTEHSSRSVPASSKAIVALGEIYATQGPEAALDKACKDELARLESVATDDEFPSKDVRLLSSVVYFLKIGAPKFVVDRSVIEQFADKDLNVDLRSQHIRGIALRRLKEKPLTKAEKAVYDELHSDYKNFLTTVNFFVIGTELAFQQENYQEALPYFVHACKVNSKLEGESAKAMDSNLLQHCRRQCLLQLNEQCITQFDSGEQLEAIQGLDIMSELVVPCIGSLNTPSASTEDTTAVEEIKGRWCNYLGQEVSGSLQDKLEDFLSKLLDITAEGCPIKCPP